MDTNGVLSAAYDADSRALRVTGLDGTYAVYSTNGSMVMAPVPNASTGTLMDTNPSYPWNSGRFTGSGIDVYMEYKVPLAAGTYTLSFQTVKNSDGGILTISVDGVDLGTTIDLYNGSLASLNTDIADVVIPTSGEHLIRVRAASKNVSSSGYRIRLSGIGWRKTA